MSRPPVFTSLDLRTALARSRSEHKLLVLDAWAPWCGPCLMMDRTTWVDEGVIAWIGSHAIAFQLDVDAHGAAARKLEVTAMPTVIVFRDGDEVDRVVGFHEPARLLEWLEGLARGVTSLDHKLAELAIEPGNALLRAEYAHMLLGARRFDDATAEYLSLCEHARGYAPLFAGDLQSLVDVHPPARQAIAVLRDELAPTPTSSVEAVRDWSILNDILREARRTLDWYDESYATHANKDELAGLVANMIGPLLVGANRWRDAWALDRRRWLRMPVRDLVSMWRVARRRLR